MTRTVSDLGWIPSSLSAPPYGRSSSTDPIGERVKYPWPFLERLDLRERDRSGVSSSGLPDVLDITEACQLRGWALNGSLSLISHSSFTMTPLFSCYYSTPGGSLWKPCSGKYGLCVFGRGEDKHMSTHTYMTVVCRVVCLRYGGGFNARCSLK